MKQVVRMFLVTAVSILLAGPAMAGQQQSQRVGDSEKLAAMHASFQEFAKNKIQRLNYNHQFSRTRMQIEKRPNGLYCARFHQIDDGSLAFQVRPSKSKKIPYVGILSYQEKVFQALGSSPDECKNGKFSAVSIIPNKHLFSYTKGAWN